MAPDMIAKSVTSYALRYRQNGLQFILCIILGAYKGQG